MGVRRRSRREELGDHIKRARKAADMTQDELARQVGVSPRQVTRWENGTTVPQRRHGERLASALNINYPTLRELIDVAGDETHDEVVRERNAALRERDLLLARLAKVTSLMEKLIAELELERQARNGRR